MKPRSATNPANLIVNPTSRKSSSALSRGDDASLSSTLTADALPRKQLRSLDGGPVHRVFRKSILKKNNKSQKSLVGASRPSLLRVRFEENRNTYYATGTMDKEDFMESWYTSDELRVFKESIIRTVKTLHKFESRNPSSGSIQHVLEATYQCCFEQDQETSRHSILPAGLSAAIKNQYRHNDEYLLGLERLIVRRIGRDRRELRKCLMEILLELQKADWPDKNVLAINIARVSAEATRASRLFARQLGSAQVPYLLTRRPSLD